MTTSTTPRVRCLIVCDNIEATFAADAVCDLEAVRYEIQADAFPFTPYQLFAFLLLSSPRAGRFPCTIKVVESQADKTVFCTNIDLVFDAKHAFASAQVRLRCTFPHAGVYFVQVYFFQPTASDILKGECP